MLKWLTLILLGPSLLAAPTVAQHIPLTADVLLSISPSPPIFSNQPMDMTKFTPTLAVEK